MATSVTDLPTIAQPFANGGQRADIPNAATGTNRASMQEGWNDITSTPIEDGGVPPNRIDFNGLGYLATLALFFLRQGGYVTYNAAQSAAIGGYPKGAVLWVEDNGVPQYAVRSTIANNTNNPASDMTGWEKLTINPSGDSMSGTLSNENSAQIRNIEFVTQEPATGVDGVIYAVLKNA